MKFKLQYKPMTMVELRAEELKLYPQIAKAKIDLAVGREKNTRKIYILRKQLAAVKSYISNLI